MHSCHCIAWALCVCVCMCVRCIFSLDVCVCCIISVHVCVVVAPFHWLYVYAASLLCMYALFLHLFTGCMCMLHHFCARMRCCCTISLYVCVHVGMCAVCAYVHTRSNHSAIHSNIAYQNLIYIHMYIHVCMHIHLCICKLTCVHMLILMCVCTHTQQSQCICKHVHIFILMCGCVHTQQSQWHTGDWQIVTILIKT